MQISYPFHVHPMGLFTSDVFQLLTDEQNNSYPVLAPIESLNLGCNCYRPGWLMSAYIKP